MAWIASRMALPGIVSLLAGCALSPAHTPLTATELPEPGALHKFVASIDPPSGSKLSPDGRKLLWQALSGTEVMTFVRRADGGNAIALRTGRKLPYWACDSRHLIYEEDPRGGENTQVMLLDLAKPGAPPLNLTPWDGSRSRVIHAGHADAGKLVFISNRRDADAYDVYSADIATGKVEMVWKNGGDVTRWIMDVDGSVGARVRRQDDLHILQMLNKTTNTWKSVSKWSQLDHIRPIRVDRAAGAVFVVSELVRDKTIAAAESRDEPDERGLPCGAQPPAFVKVLVFASAR